MVGSALTEPRGRPRFDLTLGVATHVGHWRQDDGRPWAYEPYVREMEVWARLFASVNICAPRELGPIEGNQAPYAAPNIRWHPVTYSQDYGASARVKRFLRLPTLATALYRLIRSSDLVLLRSPGHPALLGRLIADTLGTPHITKWAGWFGSYPGERLPSRLERRLIERSRWPILVYGPTERPNMVSFLPALMSNAEIKRARELATQRSWTLPWQLLSVGTLSPEKGFDLAFAGLARLREINPQLSWRYTLVGDGRQAESLRSTAERFHLNKHVTFAGALSFEAACQHYAKAHVLIMPGIFEGWPKTIAEAWAHGAVPVAAAGGLVPWIIEGKGAGITFDPTPGALAAALNALLSNPAAMQEMSRAGPPLLADLSLESFATRLEHVLVDGCGLR
jgi:glycosyltransferase involved in cell wall biosynthesis